MADSVLLDIAVDSVPIPNARQKTGAKGGHKAALSDDVKKLKSAQHGVRAAGRTLGGARHPQRRRAAGSLCCVARAASAGACVAAVRRPHRHRTLMRRTS
jgi:hypothetical protein